MENLIILGQIVSRKSYIENPKARHNIDKTCFMLLENGGEVSSKYAKACMETLDQWRCDAELPTMRK